MLPPPHHLGGALRTSDREATAKLADLVRAPAHGAPGGDRAAVPVTDRDCGRTVDAGHENRRRALRSGRARPELPGVVAAPAPDRPVDDGAAMAGAHRDRRSVPQGDDLERRARRRDGGCGRRSELTGIVRAPAVHGGYARLRYDDAA